MKLITIEPTPSPNSMKLVVNETLPMGETYNFNEKTKDEAEGLLKDLMAVDGVKGLYRVMDFIALEKQPKAAWEAILPEVRSVFGEETDGGPAEEETTPDEHFGEVKVSIQKFRGIPIQVKLEADGEEKRAGLPERFMNAVMEAQKSADNVILERQWIEETPRYGESDEIAGQVVEELSAAYDQERLDALVKAALDPETKVNGAKPFIKVTPEMFKEEDWKKRYAVLDRMDPGVEDLEVLEMALHDEKVSIRRLAAVYLGMLEDKKALPYLYEAMKDKTVTVRRTAGDALSDIGDADAIPVMAEALKDPSKIVRWRAAMFLYEEGDESALPALREAEDDPEFEVALQIRMAIKRIEGGEDARGSIWKQMAEQRRSK